ncbi:MAG: hypothetical protein L0Y77_10200 [Chlorobi bacterium]|nr:hypothetical protein [Chlorobiota bacterium]
MNFSKLNKIPWLSDECKKDFEKISYKIHECLTASDYIKMYSTSGGIRSCQSITRTSNKRVKEVGTNKYIHKCQSAFTNSKYIRGIYVTKNGKPIWRSICLKYPNYKKIAFSRIYPRSYEKAREESFINLIKKYFKKNSRHKRYIENIHVPRCHVFVDKYQTKYPFGYLGLKQVVQYCYPYIEFPLTEWSQIKDSLFRIKH